MSRELMDVISRPVVNICDGLPNCSHRLHSTDAKLLVMKESLHLQELIIGTRTHGWRVGRLFQNFLLPPCQKVSYKSSHMARCIVTWHKQWTICNKMCMLSLHCRTLVILQKITEVHCINSSVLLRPYSGGR